MNRRRGVAPPSPVETESLLTLNVPSAEVPSQESNPHVEATPAIAISIVSHSHLLSAGLLALLSPYLSLKLIGTYSSETHIGTTLPSPPGHVVLLDSGVGRAAAIAWTRHWHGLTPSAFVLVLELANDNALILACIEAGASGYTLQGATALDIAEAIKDVRGGVAHCSPEVTAQLYARVTALTATVAQLTISPLTTRESEILRYIASGYTNLEIAAQLVIELRTVKQHVHHILEKLNSGTRREAVRFATEHYWLDRDPRTP